jgi:hypothetical protein
MQLRAILFGSFLASSFVLGPTACGGDSSEFQSTGVPIEEVPAKYAAALCQAYTACLGPLAEIYLPGEDCTRRTTDAIEDGFGSIQAAVDAKRIKYDGTKVEDCIAEVEAKSCAGLLERQSEACNVVLVGTAAEGEDCSQNEECIGDAYCNFELSCPGTCTALETTGGACQDDDNCASGLICSNATELCVTPAGPGEPCEGAEPECAPGYFCKGADDDTGTSGNCRGYDEVFAAGSGDACDILANDFCDTDLSCAIDGVTADGVIEASCTVQVGSGDACKIAVPDMCPPDEYCDVPQAMPLMLEGTCTPRPEVGEPCGFATPFDETGSICEAYARCDGGNCRALATLGETCETSDVCLSGHCEGKGCVSGDHCE